MKSHDAARRSQSVYARATMQPIAVVIALLAVAGLGWLLSLAARRVLRRHGVPTDERDVKDAAEPIAGDVAGDPPPA